MNEKELFQNYELVQKITLDHADWSVLVFLKSNITGKIYSAQKHKLNGHYSVPVLQ